MPTPLPAQRNVSTSCKVICKTKATSCVPKTKDQDTQTEEEEKKVAIVPIPVPIYVPAPLHMFSMPYPVPVPFPLPIPVPVFVPTTRRSAEHILKDIQKIQDAIPRDPLEAELVTMAEVLAETKDGSEEKPEPQETVADEENEVEKVESCLMLRTGNVTEGNSGGLQYVFGVSAWRKWVKKRNTQLQQMFSTEKHFKEEILDLSTNELSFAMYLFVKEVRKPDGTEYAPDTIFYFCLGIQKYLLENDCSDNIFCDPPFRKFKECFKELSVRFLSLYKDCNYIVTRVEEEHLWETNQLGVHSPQVLLNTVIYFNTKFCRLKTVDEHLKLSFCHVVKHWRKTANHKKKVPPEGVCVRFYPPGIKKGTVYELQENVGNPLRCPVKLHEFYLSKCPQSVKTRDDVYYLATEKSCLAESPVWFSTIPLQQEYLEETLSRYRMVKEITLSLLQ